MPADTIGGAPTDMLRAAYVSRVHGVDGEVRAEALGADPARFHVGLRLTREDSGDALTVRSVRTLGDGNVLLAFEELPTAEAVKVLRNVYLCVERSNARRLGADEWFVTDLIGLRAITENGEEIGTVTDIETSPAHDVVVVGVGANAKRFPMVKEFVTAVDTSAGTMTLHPWDEV